MYFTLYSGGKKAVAVHAAVWVPDAEAVVCMHCKKNQFTVLNRRVSIIMSTFLVVFLCVTILIMNNCMVV